MRMKKITSIFWAHAWRQCLYTFVMIFISCTLFKACLFLLPESFVNWLSLIPQSIASTIVSLLYLILLGLWYCAPLFWSLKKALTITYKDFQITVHEGFIFNKAFRRFFTVYAIGVPVLSYFITYTLNLGIQGDSLLSLLIHMTLLTGINLLSLGFLFSFPAFFGFHITGNTNQYSVVI